MTGARSSTGVRGEVGEIRADHALATDDDLNAFARGDHTRLYTVLGAHARSIGGERGVSFSVWAPNAEKVSVIGDFNEWRSGEHPLAGLGDSGVWDGFLPGLREGARYKFRIESRYGGYRVDKADPFAFATELPPATASIVAGDPYPWSDSGWIRRRGKVNDRHSPQSTYEVHLGSWLRRPHPDGPFPTYGELAERIGEYVVARGFTHVELLPVMEHPFYGTWGYGTTSFFAPTRRYGAPDGLRAFVEAFHRRDVAVLLDWVPAHFPTDEHGLGYFDGTHLFEHADPKEGVHPDWHTFIFNYGRHEVTSFLLSSARFWLEEYHADGLRVDGVASMLYRDYSRGPGEWVPNVHGGRENLEAIGFLRKLNETLYAWDPTIVTVAEESTAWPMVSRPTFAGGLGFGYKWDLGWMHDTLEYLGHDPIYRRHHQHRLTFRGLYQFAENYVLPLSHDEVVHGKGSLRSKMPGDDWQKFANLRLLFGYQFALPGKKLLFMSDEYGAADEWDHDRGLDWEAAKSPLSRGLDQWVRDLNRLYRRHPALHELDTEAAGFRWIDANDVEQSVVSLLRLRGPNDPEPIVAAFNFTPVPRSHYRIGVPQPGFYRELLNGDAREYGGSGVGNLGGVTAFSTSSHGLPAAVDLTLPPLGAVFLGREGDR